MKEELMRLAERCEKAALWLLAVTVVLFLVAGWVHLLTTAPGTLERLACIPLAGILIAASGLALNAVRKW